MGTKISVTVGLAISLSSAGKAGATRIWDQVQSSHQALLENRRDVLASLSDPFGVPDQATVVLEDPVERLRQFRGWRGNTVATVFWVGETPTVNNPTPNHMSAWDTNWMENFGGYDDPHQRDEYFPAGFIPKMNPFYIALPYNDIGSDFRHRPEASEVIPWFWQSYRGEGISVCKGKWIAIHSSGKVCYAQWEDVGPFQTDHWQYVFGDQEPRDNRNGGAGIDLSPAVRDFLELSSGERVQWRFVDDRDVPDGPWQGWADSSPP